MLKPHFRHFSVALELPVVALSLGHISKLWCVPVKIKRLLKEPIESVPRQVVIRIGNLIKENGVYFSGSILYSGKLNR